MNRWLPFTLLIVMITLSLIGLSLLPKTPTSVALEPSPTPPPPTWTTGPPAEKTPIPQKSAARAADGAQIQLQVSFGENWPWPAVHWQELWTVVQWQDPAGQWHNVEGWQGQLNAIYIEDDGTITATQTWWVTEGDLGKGPFRWLLYQKRDGKLLRTSAPFLLPSRNNQTTEVTLSFEL
jgi:hypothetical protein